MYDERDQLDDKLVRLAQTLRAGDVLFACLQLAEFALKLDRVMHREERALDLLQRSRSTTPALLAKVTAEHASLRRLVAQIATALDRGDERYGLELIGKLRSVLLVHLAKEEALEPLLGCQP